MPEPMRRCVSRSSCTWPSPRTSRVTGSPPSRTRERPRPGRGARRGALPGRGARGVGHPRLPARARPRRGSVGARARPRGQATPNDDRDAPHADRRPPDALRGAARALVRAVRRAEGASARAGRGQRPPLPLQLPLVGRVAARESGCCVGIRPRGARDRLRCRPRLAPLLCARLRVTAARLRRRRRRRQEQHGRGDRPGRVDGLQDREPVGLLGACPARALARRRTCRRRDARAADGGGRADRRRGADPRAVPGRADRGARRTRPARPRRATYGDASRRGGGSGRRWAVAQAIRCRALLQAARGSLDEAADAAAEALRLSAELEHRLEHARTLLVCGQIERRRGTGAAPGEHLRAALELFDAAGAPLWAGRARAELRASGETRARSDPGAPPRLTPQELQVALCVAEGKTNKEVAAALFLSTKTVEFHLSRTYRKLGIRSRTQLGVRIAAVRTQRRSRAWPGSRSRVIPEATSPLAGASPPHDVVESVPVVQPGEWER